MFFTPTENRLLELYADMLDYPRPTLEGTVREGEALATADYPAAATALGEFRSFVEQASLGRLEELYTGTFELDATCHPYVGYHLFGESYKRSVFLLELKSRYQARSFSPEQELPDHLAVLLRFMALSDDEELAAELIQEALLPALTKMTEEEQSAEDQEQADLSVGRQVYQPVLQSLRLILESKQPAISSQLSPAECEVPGNV